MKYYLPGSEEAKDAVKLIADDGSPLYHLTPKVAAELAAEEAYELDGGADLHRGFEITIIDNNEVEHHFEVEVDFEPQFTVTRRKLDPEEIAQTIENAPVKKGDLFLYTPKLEFYRVFDVTYGAGKLGSQVLVHYCQVSAEGGEIVEVEPRAPFSKFLEEFLTDDFMPASFQKGMLLAGLEVCSE